MRSANIWRSPKLNHNQQSVAERPSNSAKQAGTLPRVDLTQTLGIKKKYHSSVGNISQESGPCFQEVAIVVR
jgi:hypothetical protein